MGDKPLGLDDEYALLMARTHELQAEHELLENRPRDLAGHREHRRKLREHIRALHEHIERVRAGRAGKT
jgi:hypothetical protein